MLEWIKKSNYAIACETHTIGKFIVNGKAIYVVTRNKGKVKVGQYNDPTVAKKMAKEDFDLYVKTRNIQQVQE